MISNTQTNELRTIYQADRGAQKKWNFRSRINIICKDIQITLKMCNTDLKD